MLRRLFWKDAVAVVGLWFRFQSQLSCHAFLSTTEAVFRLPSPFPPQPRALSTNKPTSMWTIRRQPCLGRLATGKMVGRLGVASQENSMGLHGHHSMDLHGHRSTMHGQSQEGDYARGLRILRVASLDTTIHGRESRSGMQLGPGGQIDQNIDQASISSTTWIPTRSWRQLQATSIRAARLPAHPRNMGRPDPITQTND